jgi:hypothetical protein
MKSWMMYALLALGIGIPSAAWAASAYKAACCPIPGCHCTH